MTESVLELSGIRFAKDVTEERTVWTMDGGQMPSLPEKTEAEGDWSAATFFLCMGALSERGVLVKGLDPESVQPDRAVLDVLKRAGAVVEQSRQGILVRKGKLQAVELDASQIPDAVPALAALFALCEGTTRIYRAERLRLKESDRIKSTMHMLRSLGGIVTETPDGLIIQGRPQLDGGTAAIFVEPVGPESGTRPVTREFVEKMMTGVPILDTVTLPCKVRRTGDRTFNIILVQGEEPKMDGFYLWDATGEYVDEKTGKTKTYKYKQSFPVRLFAE